MTCPDCQAEMSVSELICTVCNLSVVAKDTSERSHLPEAVHPVTVSQLEKQQANATFAVLSGMSKPQDKTSAPDSLEAIGCLGCFASVEPGKPLRSG